MNKTIYIPLDIEQTGKEYLIEKGYHLKFSKNVKKETLINDVKDCDAVLTRSNAMIDADVIKAGKNLKVISKYGVGLNNINVDVATERGIYVTNTPQANANIVAEHVIALLLSLSKKIRIMDKELRKGNFGIRNTEYSVDLKGKTLGILGLGRTGRLVAEKAAKGFQMNVIGYDPYAEDVPSTIKLVNSLERVLQTSDFISLNLPLMESTRHIIGAEQFKLMKNNAYFINTSRGGTVDEKALVQALKNNEIAGAGLDVFEVEPPDTTEELFTLDNVIVTPHTAALTDTGSAKMSLQAAMQVDQVLRGERPSWAVNEIKKTLSGGMK